MKVLIADDSPTALQMLQFVLPQWGYEPVTARSGTEAARILQADDAPRLAVLDWVMPEVEGIQLCREIRKRPPEAYVYVILLTARGRSEDLIAGLEAGADEYLVKPIDEHELKARLNTGRRIVELQERLLAAATHDSLTGLLNHGAVIDLLTRELTRARRAGQSLGVLLCDIDHFKQINDTHGHLVGDAVLRDVASCLRTSMRPYDGVGRYGGEEFLVVAPNCDRARVLDLAERLRQSVVNRPFTVPGGQVRITISLGAVAVPGPAVHDVEPILKAADDALYRAKAAGRNRVEAGAAPAAAPRTG